MKTFALVLGIIFAVIGVLGFIPGLVTPFDPLTEERLLLEGGAGRLLGLFPVNWLHNLVHLGFGAWGIVASQSWNASRLFARVTAVAYAVLVVLGLIPGLYTLFGLVPLYGHDVWLHALIAIAAAYFGWAVRPHTQPLRT